MSQRRGALPVTAAAARLAESLRSAVELMQEAAYTAPAPRLEPVEQGTLLQQCLALCERQQSTALEPVRTLHHFACTGGTLISKCVAAMPNVQLLSELDPLSTMQFNAAAKPRFLPTDMAMQMRQSTRGVRVDLLVELFREQMRLIHADATDTGYRLVLRDHTHGQYCVGTDVADRPGLLDALPPELPVRSVLTVRHPAASFASLTALKWLHFSPPSFDEYCRRYLAFLDRHPQMPIVRYEDFVERPAASMSRICELLALPFNDAFEDLFSVFRLTGDSGRAGSRIGTRSERPETSAMLASIAAAPHAAPLLERLGYATGTTAP